MRQFGHYPHAYPYNFGQQRCSRVHRGRDPDLNSLGDARKLIAHGKDIMRVLTINELLATKGRS